MFDFVIFVRFRFCVVYNFLDRIAETSGSSMDKGITARSRAKPVALEKRGKEGGGGDGARGTVVTERKASE